MKSFLLLLFCLFSFACKAPKTIMLPPVEYKEKIIERIVPFNVPSDSASLHALFSCDSLNNVILKEMGELKSIRMESRLLLENNNLFYKIYTKMDTIYVPVADTVRTETIPYAIQAPVEENKLTKFQAIQIKIAWIAEIAILCYIIFGIKWRNIINLLKNILKW